MLGQHDDRAALCYLKREVEPGDTGAKHEEVTLVVLVGHDAETLAMGRRNAHVLHGPSTPGVASDAWQLSETVARDSRERSR